MSSTSAMTNVMGDSNRLLRFGLMVRSDTLPAWQAETVERLLAVEGVDLALIIVDARQTPDRSPAQRVRRLVTSSHTLWNAYNNGWVARRARCLRHVDMSPLFGGVDRREVSVTRRGYSEYFPDDAVADIAGYDLDFIVRFAFGIIRGDVLDVARHGVWSFHHGDENVYRGSPPAFWELMDDAPVSGAILQRLTDRLDGGVVLDRGWVATARHSYVRNTDAVHLAGTAWPARAARQIQHEGEITRARPSRSDAPIYRRPSNATVARFLAVQAGRFVADQLRGIGRADFWDVGVCTSPIERFVDPSFVPDVRWQHLAEPGVAYAADPFAVGGAGDTELLYERFDARRRVGEIWSAPVDRPHDRQPTGIEAGLHTSYPFVVEVDGRRYCVPQVARDGVPLFERQASEWRHVADLLPGERVLDPTIACHEGTWWLFGTKPGSGSLSQLHVWYSDHLEGPWRPHPMNPVKTDVRSARPAGTPFVDDGVLYRPTQDCAGGYGTGVSLCRIDRLDRNDFSERVISVVRPLPDWANNAGVHTLARMGDNTLLDARRSIVDRHEMAAELRARLARLLPARRSEIAPPSADNATDSDLRVLAVIDALGEGGTERSLAELIGPLGAYGVAVTVATLRSRGDEGVENLLRSQGVNIHRLPSRDRVRALRRLIDDVDPDVVHSMLFESNMVTRLASVGSGRPVLTSLTSTSYSPERRRAGGTNPAKLAVVQAVDAVSGRLLVDHFHAVSEAVREHAERQLRVPPGRLTVVRRGRGDPRRQISAEAGRAVRDELGIPPDDVVVVHVGRQEHSKDHRTLLAAVDPLLGERPAWLLAAGRRGNASDTVTSALSEAEHRDRIRFLGHRGDVPAVLAAADLLVLTSRYEGLPGAIIEAMAAGLPVVASDIDPVHEVVVPGETGFVCPPGDAVAFRDAISRLLDDASLRRRMGERGRSEFEQRFTIDRSARDMADLYRKLTLG